MSETKSIYLVSNAQRFESSNTLAKFRNEMPTDQLSKVGVQYQLCCDQIAFDDVFDCSFLPERLSTPPIICTEQNPSKKFFTEQDLRAMPDSNKIHLPRRSYGSWNELAFYVKTSQKSTNHSNVYDNLTPPCLATERLQKLYFGAFGSYKKLKPISVPNIWFLYIYKPLAERIIDYDDEVYKRNPPIDMKICDEDFLGFRADPETAIYFKVRDRVKLQSDFDHILFLECSDIASSRYNNTLRPFLLSLCLDHDRTLVQEEVDRYKTFYFPPVHPQFLHLSTDDLRSIQLKLVTRDGRIAPLQRGRATLAHLTVRPVLKGTMEEHIVTVTSDKQPAFPSNNQCHFSTYLEPPLYFPPSSKWRVALLSASIMNRFRLPFSDLERSMYVSLLNDDDEEDYSQPLMLSRGLGSMNEFCGEFNSYFTPNQARASINVHSGTLQIESNKFKLKLVATAKFLTFLGAAESTQESEIVEIVRSKRQPLVLPFQAQFNLYSPGHIFVYCSAVDESLVAGQMLKVLRIVEATKADYGSKKVSFSKLAHHSFERLQWHNLTSVDSVSKISIVLRTQSGSNVPFDLPEDEGEGGESGKLQEAPTVMNLLFQRIE